MKFPNTPEGRKEADDYSMLPGNSGYWDDYVDFPERRDPDEVKAEGESAIKMALLAVASVALNDPEAISPADACTVGTELARRNIHVPGLPVDMSAFGTPPMQPGESSWASFRCGGGPHATDNC